MEKLVFIPFMFIVILIALTSADNKGLKHKKKELRHKTIVKNIDEKV